MQPWCTPFPILNQSIVPCLVQTFASCPACRFPRRQVRWSIIPISLIISTGCFCDPQCQRLYHSQWTRSKCVFGIPFLFLWSRECWQFDFWFLCLFKIQLLHLEVLSSLLLKPSLKDFEHNVGENNKVIYISEILIFIALFLSLVVQTVMNLPTMQETWVGSWVRKIPLRSKWWPTPVLLPGKSHGQRRQFVGSQ